MSRNPRTRSNERNISPKTKDSSSRAMSNINNKSSHSGRNINDHHQFSASAIAAVTAAVEPETPAQMSERLRAERQQSLIDLQLKADNHCIAESIGFALAHEIGERAVDLYIKTTYDDYANEYTALAVWDEMMDAIGSFAQAVPANLPENSHFGKIMFADPNSPTGMTRSAIPSSSTASMIQTAIARLHNKLPDPPGIRTSTVNVDDIDTPEKILGRFSQTREEAAAAAGSKTSTSAVLSSKPGQSALKSTSNTISSSSSVAAKDVSGTTTVSSASSPGAGDDASKPKERRRVRLTVTEPEEDEKDQKQSNSKDDGKSLDRKTGAAGGSASMTAREQLQIAVEQKLREENNKKELDLLRSPLHAQIALANLQLDCGVPDEADPSWIADAAPPPMFCDLTARHAAGLKLKTIDTQQLANAIALNAGLNSSGEITNSLGASIAGGNSTMNLLGATSGMGGTSRAGRSMTMTGGAAGTASHRRSMMMSLTALGGTRSASGSGGNQSLAQQQNQPARPLSPTQLTLNEVSKNSIPIHILTHHMSMMASRSPYVPRTNSTSKNDQSGKGNSNNNNKMDGAPPDLGDGYHYGEMPPTGRGSNNNNNNNTNNKFAFGMSEDIERANNFENGIPTITMGNGQQHIPIPEAEDQQSSAFSSLEQDDDSHQSPSEVEVTQRLQTRQAQKTRNNNAFNTITNQLAELTNTKGSGGTSSGGGFNNNNNNSNSYPISGTTGTSAAADRNLVVDARLGRVIPVISVDNNTAGGNNSGGGAKKGGKSGGNPLTEAPRVNVQMPAPPPVEPPANSREARLARRAATLRQQNQISQSATSSPEKQQQQQQNQPRPPSQPQPQQQQQSSPARSASSYSPSFNSNLKKKRKGKNDPSNFFEPEPKIVPMIQNVNPSGGVIVKDESGSRRNERPQQVARLSRDDYKKILRMGPSSAQQQQSGGGIDFGWNQSNQQPQSASSHVSNNNNNRTADGFNFQQQQVQTARNNNNNNNQNVEAAVVGGSSSKTARR